MAAPGRLKPRRHAVGTISEHHGGEQQADHDGKDRGDPAITVHLNVPSTMNTMTGATEHASRTAKVCLVFQ